MADDTKKVGGTTAPTQVVGPQGRGPAPEPKPEERVPVETSLEPARTGVVDRQVEGVAVASGAAPIPEDAGKKLDEAAAIRADFGKPKELLKADQLEREANDLIARQAQEEADK